LTQRVSLFVATLAGGGAERVAANLSSGLSNLGYAVDLIVCDGTGAMRRVLKGDVRLIDLRCGKVKWAVLHLRRYFLKRRPSAVISIQTDCNLATLIVSRLVRKPPRIIISEHNICKKPGERNSLGVLFRRFLIKRLYPHADAMVAVSKGVKSDYQELIGTSCCNVKVVYNPAYDEDTLGAKAEAHSCSMPSSDSPFVLAVGRLTRQKGFDSLVEAFSQISELVDCNVVILGEGEERTALQEQIDRLGLRRRISLKGFVGDPCTYFKGASLFVLSSRWEGFGLVLVEALAYGKRIVSTNCRSGPSEILENGKYGRLVPEDDVAALAHAIAEELKAPDTHEKRKARMLRAQEFSIETAAHRYARLLYDTGY
jgi:glycosyltransferase involved in cell wall biosynthesis